MTITKLLVNRQAIGEAKIVERESAALASGEVRIQTGRFALTANNITYALSGEMIGYWRFFPDAEEGWGIVPAWGHATVVESRCDDLPVGSGFWGFLPMASELVMLPAKVKPGSFVDDSPHRRELPYVYNQYARTDDDPAALVALSDQRSLLFPLFTTGYVIDDYIADNGGFGASQVIIGSASSKTAFGLAHYVSARGAQKVIGLTSPRNIGFVEALGMYDEVLAYDGVTMLDPGVPTVFVDMSGNGDVVAAIHDHFADQLKASIGVGATHWEVGRARSGLPGPKPSFFFAPAQIAKRDADWGPGELMRRATRANIEFCETLGDRMQIVHASGAEPIALNYRAMAAGLTPPDRGLILSFA